MRITRTLKTVIGIVVLLVVAIAALPVLLSSDFVRGKIEALASEQLDAPLKLDEIRLSWFGGLTIRGLALGNPPGFSAGRFVSCAEASGGIALWPLLRGEIHLKTIRLDRPQLLVERAADGRWNFASIRKGAAPASGPPPALPKLKARLEFTNAQLEVRDDRVGSNTQASGVSGDVSADLTGSESDYTFRLSVPKIAATQSMSPLLGWIVPIAAAGESGAEISGELMLEGRGSFRGHSREAVSKSLEAQGRVTLANGRLSGSPLAAEILGLLGEPSSIEVQSLDAPFRVSDGAVSLENTTLTGSRLDLRFGGKVGLDGRLDLTALAKPREGAAGADARQRLTKLLARSAELKFAIRGTPSQPQVSLEGGSAGIDPKSALEQGAGEALKLFEKRGGKEKSD